MEVNGDKKALSMLLAVLVCLLPLSGCRGNDTPEIINEHIYDQEEPLSLFHDLEEISLEEYFSVSDRDKEPAPAVILNAEKAGRVTVNKELLAGDCLEGGDRLELLLFEESCIVKLNKVEEGEMLVLSGHEQGDKAHNLFSLSLSGDDLFLSLERLDEGVIYKLVTEPRTGDYYFFKSPLSASGSLECGGVLIPVEKNDREKKNGPFLQQDGEEDNGTGQPEIQPAPGTVALLLGLEEVSRAAYQQKYGSQSLTADPVAAAAVRIGRVAINRTVLEGRSLRPGDLISVRLFDGREYRVVIRRVTTNLLVTISGKVEGSAFGFMTASVDGEKMLASIELPEENRFFLFKYNNEAGCHYLFEAPLDKIEKLED